MEEQWYFGSSIDDRQGPVDAANLTRLWLTGELDREGYVWNAETQNEGLPILHHPAIKALENVPIDQLLPENLKPSEKQWQVIFAGCSKQSAHSLAGWLAFIAAVLSIQSITFILFLFPKIRFTFKGEIFKHLAVWEPLIYLCLLTHMLVLISITYLYGTVLSYAKSATPSNLDKFFGAMKVELAFYIIYLIFGWITTLLILWNFLQSLKATMP